MHRLLPISVAALLFAASPAFADEATDLAAIKAQIKLMQHDYDTKIHSLEVRLAQSRDPTRKLRAWRWQSRRAPRASRRRVQQRAFDGTDFRPACDAPSTRRRPT